MDWNDYAGLDMRGKTAVILVNDPGFATGDPALFKGRAMTYHGRWTYKFEEAARQGAAGAIIVHEEAPAAYPWEVLQNGAKRPQLAIETADGDASRSGIEGWMTRESAVRVFHAAGLDYDTVKAAPHSGFPSDVAAAYATTRVRTTSAGSRRTMSSGSCRVEAAGRIRDLHRALGSPRQDAEGSGDTIFNGAVDNATGTGALIELARAFGRCDPRPSARSCSSALLARNTDCWAASTSPTTRSCHLRRSPAASTWTAWRSTGGPAT